MIGSIHKYLQWLQIHRSRHLLAHSHSGPPAVATADGPWSYEALDCKGFRTRNGGTFAPAQVALMVAG
jgi:hypothetical protein